MTQKLLRWIRVVLPEPTFVAVAIGCEILIELVYLFQMLRGWVPDDEAFRRLRLGWLSTCAFGYGFTRIAHFHPVFNQQYCDWLQTTPWKAGMPLPGGPIRQIPQDLVVLAGLMLLTHENSVRILALPLLFLVAYFTTLAFASRACGDWGCAYLLGFGLGAIGLGSVSIPTSLIIAMACYPLAFLAIERSLRRYPWDFEWRKVTKYTQNNPEELHRERLGWPHDFMSAKPPQIWLPYSDGVCLGLLAGWYLFVLHVNLPSQGRPILCGFTVQILSIPILLRAGIYMTSHRWPINLSGRIFTLRWIIPKYDVIYVAPLLAELILVGSQSLAAYCYVSAQPFGPPWMALNEFKELIAIGSSSMGIGAAVIVSLVMGPVLERWRLAGKHRIVFDQSGMVSKTPQAQFIEL